MRSILYYRPKIFLDLPTEAVISYLPMDDKHMENDRRLVEACIQKDLRAWSSLISKYSRLVYISIDNRLKKYGFTLPSDEIKDISQDIFTMIWRDEKLKNIINTDDISYWIAMVSGNAAISYIRRNENRERIKTVSIHEKFQDKKEFTDIIPSRSIRPDDDTEETETAGRIDGAIKKLSSREKIMIKLHLIHNKKYGDIARMLDLPKGTVSSCIKRAKEKLKNHLKDLG